jgi:cellulose synthase/poly-beta-1,6-N-acetylglucosamine synthase-like glycosyltransferase
MWLALVVIAVLLLLGYAVLIENYRRWFLEISPFDIAGKLVPALRFSVIIPARNEAANIGACLTTILNQQYPAEYFEVIVVNDHSTDSTGDVVRSLQKEHANLRLLDLEELLKGKALNSYKKKAIELAIFEATGDFIVTTDADCFVADCWLKTFAVFIQENDAAFVAAPVKFINTGSFLSIFQCLDFVSLQGITAASVSNNFHSMCNGANLAYSRKAFNEVGGFAGIDNIASGDDMLLMHKIYLRQPQNVKFLLAKASIVQTTTMKDWTSFVHQRIRWASKADTYDDKRIFWVLALVYIMNSMFVVILFAAMWKPMLFLYWLSLLISKTIIELRFMGPVAAFFNEQKLLGWFPVMQPFHIFYTVVAGWLGKFGSYKWKGRTVK